MMNRPSRRRQRGSSMVELALAVPVMTIAFAGCFQFGYYFYIYGRLENAVRAGARYAAVRNYDSSSETPSTAFSTAVKNMAVYADPGGGTSAVVPGLSTSNVSLTVTMGNNIPSEMTVSISGFQVDTVFKTFTMTGKPFATFRYGGKLSPAP